MESLSQTSGGYKPNAPFNGNLSPKAYTRSTPDGYNIGYGIGVLSFAAGANLGNYSVELEYTVTFHNSGHAKSIEYWITGQSDYIINFNGVYKNKGETTNVNTSACMATFDIPNGTTTVTFSIVLPTANASSIINYFKVVN